MTFQQEELKKLLEKGKEGVKAGYAALDAADGTAGDGVSKNVWKVIGIVAAVAIVFGIVLKSCVF